MDLKLSRRKALLGTPLLLGSSQAAADPALVARAFAMRDKAVAEGDQPYGAIVVRGADILAEMPSRVVVNGDPTAHAEMEAIRAAAKASGSRDLSGAVLVSSSRPCPMCEAAAYWAGISRLIHGRTGEDGGPPRLCG